MIKVQDRDNLKAYLQSKNIQTQIHYYQPLSSQKMFATGEEMPNAVKFCKDVLSIPIHPFLKDHEVTRVCKCIGDFYGV